MDEVDEVDRMDVGATPVEVEDMATLDML